jgi:hypothetical protein
MRSAIPGVMRFIDDDQIIGWKVAGFGATQFLKADELGFQPSLQQRLVPHGRQSGWRDDEHPIVSARDRGRDVGLAHPDFVAQQRPTKFRNSRFDACNR